MHYNIIVQYRYSWYTLNAGMDAATLKYPVNMPAFNAQLTAHAEAMNGLYWLGHTRDYGVGQIGNYDD